MWGGDGMDANASDAMAGRAQGREGEQKVMWGRVLRWRGARKLGEFAPSDARAAAILFMAVLVNLFYYLLGSSENACTDDRSGGCRSICGHDGGRW